MAQTRLIDHDGRRDNNLTLIRLVFAWLVLWGHSFAIQPSEGIRDPLTRIFEGSTWIGAIAVDGFFVISGFLVCASLVKRGAADYTVSRSLRIFPALVVCVFVSTFVLGPALTTLPLTEYLSHEETWAYLRNALAYFGMLWELPGVFQDNKWQSVNGSLWTLTVEVRCYILLAIAGALNLLKYRATANVIMLALLALGFYYFDAIPLMSGNERWARPALYFLIGVAFYMNRDQIILDMRLALAAAILAYASFGEPWFQYAFPLCLSYLIFYVAYAIKHFDLDTTVGDMSYGVYIYAWPTQQCIATLFPQASPYLAALLSTLIVVTLAQLSWRFIEKPALSLKPRFMRSLQA